MAVFEIRSRQNNVSKACQLGVFQYLQVVVLKRFVSEVCTYVDKFHDAECALSCRAKRCSLAKIMYMG